MESDHFIEELNQVHEYKRHMFQIFLQWFAFFASANYLAMGWFAGKDSGAALAGMQVLVSRVFLGQNVLGIVASVFAMLFFIRMDSRANELVSFLGIENKGLAWGRAVNWIYLHAALLIVLAQVIFVVGWAAMLQK